MRIVLYYFALAIAVADVFVRWKWYVIFYPHIEGVMWYSDIMYRPSISPIGQFIVSVVFVGCMLRWREFGGMIVFIYSVLKIPVYLSLLGLYLGTNAIESSVGIPAYLIAYEVCICLVLIVYLVTNDSAAKANKL